MKEDAFSYDTIGELVDSCVTFYEAHKDELSANQVRKNRSEIAGFVESFHRQCGTFNLSVQKRIDDLKGGVGLVVMTAHQPNLFPYDGVMRKATLAFVLAKKLEQRLKVPVVNVFGIADQDFGEDRWVKSMTLPDVERRDGFLELRLSLPEKLMFNKIQKPSENTLSLWRKEIIAWINREILLARQVNPFVQLCKEKEERVKNNFDSFWSVVEDAYQKASVFSDFNAFVISKIVNEIWDYDTLFVRFSECQQSLLKEFSFLLCHFGEYSHAIGQAISSKSSMNGGVSNNEWEFAPFWYHCDCGSKVRLVVSWQGKNCFGSGNCLLCGKEHKFNFGSQRKVELSEIMARISARSISMPLVVLNGLGVTCYVGGQGGKDYLSQAKQVAKSIGIYFPPIVVWRPKDNYFGLGQLSALVTLGKITGSFDQSDVNSIKKKIEQKIAQADSDLSDLEQKKKELLQNTQNLSKADIVVKLRELAVNQNEIRRREKYSELVRDLKLIDNAIAALNLHPSIIDYAVSVGLKETSAQWIAGIEDRDSWSKGCRLKTAFDC